MTTVNNIIYKNINGDDGLDLAVGEGLVVKANAAIYAMGNPANAVSADGASSVQIDGALFSDYSVGFSATNGGNEITVSSTGSIFGRTQGIYVNGAFNTVENAGSIDSLTGAAVYLTSGAGNNELTNTGSLRSAAFTAVVLLNENNAFTNGGSGQVEGGANSYAVLIGGNVNNMGLITGGGGVSMASGSVVLNTGSIIANRADLAGISGSSEADLVVNKSLIQGQTLAVTFNAGNDKYDGTQGKAVGEVNGGSGDDTLLGGAFADDLAGWTDNDTLNGGGGIDTLDGGAGNDTFQLGADTTDLLSDVSGTDTVTSTVTRSLGTWAFVENLVLEGVANINGTGNAGFNSIVGNSGNNTLAGQAGNDVLVGGGGNDKLFGQADKDSLTGGAGNDQFIFQAVAHTAAGMGDVVVDFDDTGDDLLDLSGIAGVNAYIGQAAFSAAGQVRATQVGANVLIEINTAGNSVAEGEITLLNTTLGNGVGQLAATDFLL